MHPQDVSEHNILLYGQPTVRSILGLTYAYFEPGVTQGWKIAKKLAEQNLLSDAAKQLLEVQTPITPADWVQIAKVEEIPLAGYRVPMITEKLEHQNRRARLSDVTFDQDFTTTLYNVIESYIQTIPGRTTVYPVLDGPPGASKSLVAMVSAALLKIPVWTVTGSDGSADEIKIDLLGGDNPNTMDLVGLAKHYINIGWIHNAQSYKLIAQNLNRYQSIDAIPDNVLREIATLEKLKENITFYSPGKFELVAKHGGLLFLDELNGFKGVTTILTQLLENYTYDMHPMAFIMGALNPAGEKHARDPLPPEIRSRMCTYYVQAPSEKSYKQMLDFYFSGEQPIITLPNNAKLRIKASMLGVTILPKKPSLLISSLDSDSFDTLIGNIAKAHKSLESLYEAGKIDPKYVADPKTDETTSIDRRTLVRLLTSIDTFLKLSVESTDMSVTETSWESYLHAATKLTLNKEQIVNAIARAIQKIYIQPFNFTISEEIELEKGKKRFANASEIISAALDLNGLSIDKLNDYIATALDISDLKDRWQKYYSEHPYYTESNATKIVDRACASKLDTRDRSKFFFIRIPSTSGVQVQVDATTTVQLATELVEVPFMATKASRKIFLEKYFPDLNFTSKVKAVDIIQRGLAALGNDFKFVPIQHNNMMNNREELEVYRASISKTAAYFCLTESDTGYNLVLFLPIIAIPEEYRNTKFRGKEFAGVIQPNFMLKSQSAGSAGIASIAECFQKCYATQIDNKPIDLSKVTELVFFPFGTMSTDKKVRQTKNAK